MEKIQEPVIVCVEESEQPGIEVRGNQERLLNFAQILRKHGISYHFNYEKVCSSKRSKAVGTFMVAVVPESTKETIEVLAEWLKNSADRMGKPPVQVIVRGETVGLSTAQIERIKKILREE